MNTEIRMILTEDCNLRCSYCFINKHPKEMSYEVIDKTFELVDTELLKENHVRLAVFGGEPLLAFDKIKYIIEKVKEINDVNVKVFIYTNGILLNNDEICKYLKENLKYIEGFNFSIDGCEEAHDRNRYYLNKKGSYKEVIQGVLNFCKITGFDVERIAPRAMISPDNCDLLLKSIEELTKLGFKKLSFCPVRDNIWDNESIERYKKAVIQAKEWYIKNQPKGYYLELFDLPLKRVRDFSGSKVKWQRFCNAGSTQYCINPVGDIYPCSRFATNHTYQIGNLFNKNYFTGYERNFNLFQKHTRVNYVNCCNCETFKNNGCHGMCAASVYETNSALFTTIPSVCEILKFNYEMAKEIQKELFDK